MARIEFSIAFVHKSLPLLYGFYCIVRAEDLALVDCALADGRSDRLDRLQDH